MRNKDRDTQHDAVKLLAPEYVPMTDEQRARAVSALAALLAHVRTQHKRRAAGIASASAAADTGDVK